MSDFPCHTAPVQSLASISVGGADAQDFLAAQLSQMPPGPDASRAVFAAWHDPKGRVQALFRVLRREADFLLLTHTSVAADVVTALQRFVLRAKVAIEVLDEHDAAVAVLGDCNAWLARRGVKLGDQAGAVAHDAGTDWLRIGPTLIYAMAPRATLDELLERSERGSSAEADLIEIRAGLALVSAPLRGMFLPQMLDLDRLGGIAFDKGCYPGQEIIARVQNLGSVKRRLRRLVGTTANGAPTPGSSVLDAADHEVGTVVRTASLDETLELLAVVELDAVAPLRCREPDDLTLTDPAEAARREP